MVAFLVLASLLGVYVTLLLRKVLSLERDTPLVIFLMMPYVLQMAFGVFARKDKWSLRVHTAGMFILCLVGGYFWSLAAVHVGESSGEARMRAREFFIFVAEVLGAAQWLFVALMVAIAWAMRRK